MQERRGKNNHTNNGDAKQADRRFIRFLKKPLREYGHYGQTLTALTQRDETRARKVDRETMKKLARSSFALYGSDIGANAFNARFVIRIRRSIRYDKCNGKEALRAVDVCMGDRLTTRDTNRIVRPVEWGFDWLEDFARPRGLMPADGTDLDPAAAEDALLAINDASLRDRDSFYGYVRPTDFRLEERHPLLFPTNVRPETLRRDAAASRSGRSRSARKQAHFLRFTSPVRTPYPENDLVNARWYPAPPEQSRPASPSRPLSSCRSGTPMPSVTTPSARSSTASASLPCAFQALPRHPPPP